MASSISKFIVELISSISETVKHATDGISVAVWVTALAGWLPALAALASLIWTGLRIFEWFEKRRQAKQNNSTVGKEDAALASSNLAASVIPDELQP
jgi:hypothetical protein